MWLRPTCHVKATNWVKQVDLVQSWHTKKHTQLHPQISTHFLHFQTYCKETRFDCSSTFAFDQWMLWYIVKAWLSFEGWKWTKDQHNMLVRVRLRSDKDNGGVTTGCFLRVNGGGRNSGSGRTNDGGGNAVGQWGTISFLQHTVCFLKLV